MIGCPKPSKGLNLDQKKAVTGVQILITTINFWVLTIKYGILHIILFQIVPSKGMNVKKGN